MSEQIESQVISRRKLFLLAGLAAGFAAPVAVLTASNAEAQQPEAQQPSADPTKKTKKKKKPPPQAQHQHPAHRKRHNKALLQRCRPDAPSHRPGSVRSDWVLALVLAVASLTAGCFEPLYGTHTSVGHVVPGQRTGLQFAKFKRQGHRAFLSCTCKLPGAISERLSIAIGHRGQTGRKATRSFPMISNRCFASLSSCPRLPRR